MRLRVWRSKGFGVWGSVSNYRERGLGTGVWGGGARVGGLGCRVSWSGVWGLGFRSPKATATPAPAAHESSSRSHSG